MANTIIQFEIESGIPIPVTPPRGSCKCGGCPREGYKSCDKCLSGTKRHRRNRMDRGLCEYFGCKAAPKQGRTSCETHLKKMLAYSLVKRAQWMKTKTCVECGKRPQWWTQRCVLCRSNYSDGLPQAAIKVIRQYRRLESIDKRRAKAEELAPLIHDDRARRIISLRHGLTDGIDHTLEDIGAELLVTRERVRQIEARALNILKYQGEDVSLIRPPFEYLQRSRKRASNVSDEQKKKNKAHRLVRDAILRGVIVKQSCQECGDVKAVGHHRDYDKPLEVEWLCGRHHMAAHGRGKGDPQFPRTTVPHKAHSSTWLNKVKPTNEHYAADKIVRTLRSYQVKQGDLCRATGLPRQSLIDIVHGRPVSDYQLLAMLRYVEQLSL